MRTSATGSPDLARCRSPRGGSRPERGAQAANDRVVSFSAKKQGFTLVELMATLAIIGLAAGAVMLTLPDTTPGVADEAARLGARLTAAREEAVMTNRTVAIEATAAGYAAQVFDGDGWKPLNDGPFRPEAWQAGTTLKGDAVRVAFDPTGVAEPATIVLTRATAASTISIDGAGEVRIR